MKQLTTFILLFACLATQSQSWDWQWTRQLKGADGAWCQVVATDNLNQSYLVATYEDTLVMGDTTFRHPYKYNQMQSVIGIYDQFGKFRKAMDFYSPAGYQPIPVSVKPENSHSILVGGTLVTNTWYRTPHFIHKTKMLRHLSENTMNRESINGSRPSRVQTRIISSISFRPGMEHPM